VTALPSPPPDLNAPPLPRGDGPAGAGALPGASAPIAAAKAALIELWSTRCALALVLLTLPYFLGQLLRPGF
jgi:hypothetical protein